MRVVARQITIPVIVHVVHKREEENSSDAQVESQIEALNRVPGRAGGDRWARRAPARL